MEKYSSMYDLADILLNLCLEKKDKKVSPQMLCNKTNASCKEMNELKMILSEYGTFNGEGFGDCTWTYFQLYETKVDFVENGGFASYFKGIEEINNDKENSGISIGSINIHNDQKGIFANINKVSIEKGEAKQEKKGINSTALWGMIGIIVAVILFALGLIYNK